MRIALALLLALGSFLAASGNLAAQESDPMLDLIDQWETNFNSGNFDAVAALYTADAMRFPPGQPPQQGQTAIAADMPSYAHLAIELELLGSEMAGDVLSSWGTYALRPKGSEAGAAPVQSGPWMNVSKKGADGSWKIHRDIWNVRQEQQQP